MLEVGQIDENQKDWQKQRKLGCRYTTFEYLKKLKKVENG